MLSIFSSEWINITTKKAQDLQDNVLSPHTWHAPHQGKHLHYVNILKRQINFSLLQNLRLCMCLISVPHTMGLIGLFTSQIINMHANVFNVGDGSQSWFHMNNDDGKM